MTHYVKRDVDISKGAWGGGGELRESKGEAELWEDDQGRIYGSEDFYKHSKEYFSEVPLSTGGKYSRHLLDKRVPQKI